MWSFVVLICSVVTNSCIISGPQTLFFQSQSQCETYAAANIAELDLTKVNVTYKCISWGKPV